MAECSYFFLFFSFPLAFDFTAELETLCRVTAWWEHNRSKTKEHWDKVNFTKVFCETSWSHGEMLVTNFSACIIILELPLYYKLYHIDISTNESPQKQQKPERHSNIQEQEEKKSNLFLLPDSYHHFLVLLLLFSWFILFLRINWFFFLKMFSSFIFHMTSRFHLSLVISEWVWTVSHTRKATFCSLIFL